MTEAVRYNLIKTYIVSYKIITLTSGSEELIHDEDSIIYYGDIRDIVGYIGDLYATLPRDYKVVVTYIYEV